MPRQHHPEHTPRHDLRHDSLDKHLHDTRDPDRSPPIVGEADGARAKGVDANDGPASASVVPFPVPAPRPKGGRVLLLQGPVGPFFGRLAETFAARGLAVDRVRFNAGDAMFSRSSSRFSIRSSRRAASSPESSVPGLRLFDYREGRALWGEWLDAHLRAHPPALIVLFGAERPQHRIARRVAAERGVPVVSLEEGYQRPGYVTVERGANNWRSPLAGQLPPERMKEPRQRPLSGRSFWWMVRWGFLYFGWRNLAARGRQRELFHKQRPSWHEAPLWARNAWRRIVRTDPVVPRLTGELKGRFDLVPLQVSDDAQLKAAARGWTNRRLIVAAIASFAARAPEDRHLVFKVHPLERGHTADHKVVARLAAMHGVSDRVHCIMSGQLGLITRAARGMIVINSTSGLTAISHRKPLLVLGHALYRNEALARCGEGPRSIDAFWTDDFVGDERLARHYAPWLVRNALVAGDFYDPAVMDETARNVAARALNIARRAREAGARPEGVAPDDARDVAPDVAPDAAPHDAFDAPSDAVVPFARRPGL